MRMTIRAIIAAAILFTLVFVGSSVTVARNEDTPANQIAHLAELIAVLFERVEAMEHVWKAQGAPEYPDGSCFLFQFDGHGRAVKLQRPTVLHHIRQFDTVPTEITLRHVRHDPETSITHILYETMHSGDAFYALESWRGCEFDNSTEWVSAFG